MKALLVSDRLGTLETQILEFSGEMVFFCQVEQSFTKLIVRLKMSAQIHICNLTITKVVV